MQDSSSLICCVGSSPSIRVFDVPHPSQRSGSRRSTRHLLRFGDVLLDPSKRPPTIFRSATPLFTIPTDPTTEDAHRTRELLELGRLRFKPRKLSGDNSRICQFPGCDSYLVAVARSQTPFGIRFYDVMNGKLLRCIYGLFDRPLGLDCFAVGDGGQVLVLSGMQDRRIMLWDAVSGKLVVEFEETELRSVGSFSWVGRIPGFERTTFFAAEKRCVARYEFGSGSRLARVGLYGEPSSNPYSTYYRGVLVAGSQRRRQLFLINGSKLWCYDTETCQVVDTVSWDGIRARGCAMCAEDENQLIVGTTDDGMRVFDLRNLRKCIMSVLPPPFVREPFLKIQRTGFRSFAALGPNFLFSFSTELSGECQEIEKRFEFLPPAQGTRREIPIRPGELRRASNSYSLADRGNDICVLRDGDLGYLRNLSLERFAFAFRGNLCLHGWKSLQINDGVVVLFPLWFLLSC